MRDIGDKMRSHARSYSSISPNSRDLSRPRQAPGARGRPYVNDERGRSVTYGCKGVAGLDRAVFPVVL